MNTIPTIRQNITNLKGQVVECEINKGRNRIVKVRATIDAVYPSLFTIKPLEECDLDRTSYSYCDMLCGQIKILN